MRQMTIYRLFGFGAAIFLTACQPAEQKVQEQSQKCVAPEKLVKQIYDQELKLHALSKDQLAAYFEPSLAERMQAEINCKQSQQVCNVDFDIFTDSQDPQQDSKKGVQPKLSFDENKNVVRAEFKIGDEAKVLNYEMSDGDCSKIKNIVYAGDYDLDMILSNPTETIEDSEMFDANAASDSTAQ
ncbi:MULTISPECIES: hypothetical protein [Acinetobacter]|uniref:hypothetical protein n=1 Tax=Acinetobacter TaxID=469 RepID=UPI0015D437E2|nr:MULTISPECIES: hypothetical protein [Acinetobacter]MCL6233366.1 hypothetical protein [Acinetobacter amyesii]QOW50062.1 hypothetical protein G0029_09875 [Acinetobacter sp. YH12138]